MKLSPHHQAGKVRNGAMQPHDATLTAQIAGVQIAGVQLASFALSSVDPGIWTTHAGEADILTAGTYLVSFVFNTPDTPANPNPANPGGIYNAKDLVIDRAYILADPGGTGTAIGGGTPVSTVPEPGSLAVLAAAWAAWLGLRHRRRKSA